MPTTINDTIDQLINTPLSALVGISVLPGYMVHYANDLMDPNNPITFPAVAFQPVADNTVGQHGGTKLKCDRIMRVIGAIDVKDPSTVNQRLNDLLFEVRKALIVNNNDNQLLGVSLNFGTVNFNLPDSQDQYSFFELDITITYIEELKP